MAPKIKLEPIKWLSFLSICLNLNEMLWSDPDCQQFLHKGVADNRAQFKGLRGDSREIPPFLQRGGVRLLYNFSRLTVLLKKL